MANIVAIILARGGSKGIPRKNIMRFCGKPLIAWTIECVKRVKEISSVWVSSDDDEILEVAKHYGANIIRRPSSLATSRSRAVDGWLHAINTIQQTEGKIDVVIAPQVTSPIREPNDVLNGIKKFLKDKYTTMFSGSIIGDFLIWEKRNNNLQSVNFDYKHWPRRQEFPEQFVANGSFWIFTPRSLKKYNNQLGGKIGVAPMEFWKSFEIDEPHDIELCELIMKHYILNKKPSAYK